MGGTYVLVLGERADVLFRVGTGHRGDEVPESIEGHGDVAGNQLGGVQGGGSETLDSE
jgi:hypothetical protein